MNSSTLSPIITWLFLLLLVFNKLRTYLSFIQYSGNHEERKKWKSLQVECKEGNTFQSFLMTFFFKC